MKVLVCGGRHYGLVGRGKSLREACDERRDLTIYLSGLHADTPITCVMHGGATGADSCAGQWAKTQGLPVEVFPADWTTHGRAAGPIRNRVMLDQQPALVVAFPGGAGTRNLVKQAATRGIRTVEL